MIVADQHGPCAGVCEIRACAIGGLCVKMPGRTIKIYVRNTEVNKVKLSSVESCEIQFFSSFVVSVRLLPWRICLINSITSGMQAVANRESCMRSASISESDATFYLLNEVYRGDYALFTISNS